MVCEVRKYLYFVNVDYFFEVDFKVDVEHVVCEVETIFVLMATMRLVLMLMLMLKLVLKLVLNTWFAR